MRQRAGQVPGAPVLQISHLGIERSGTVILDDVSWRVEKGEHWAILGANGAGKTSLLSALMGYLPATRGEIEVLGQRYGSSDWRELRRRIGIASSALLPMLPDRETAERAVISGKQAMLGSWGEPPPEDRARGRRLLRQIECTALADRPWGVLSQGERQRVLIGRALMANPPLLVLDEPCAGLDPAAREHFLQFLRRLAAKRGCPSLVLVTHHVEEITPIFSHVLFLRQGRAIAAGPKKQTLTSRWVSATFGTRMQLREEAGRYTLRVAPVRSAVV
jgi:iron complex transport system ATP-binding protein